MRKMTLPVIITGIAMILGASEQASADVVFATGFEPPTYTTGALSGQDGWNNNGGGAVETTTIFAGSQAVKYDATGHTGQSVDAHAVPLSGQGPQMRATVEFFVSANDPDTFWEVLGFFGNGSFLGQLVVNNGDAFLGTSRAIGSVPVTIGAWNSYEMDFNFTTDTVAAFVDGTLIGSDSINASNTAIAVVDIGRNGEFPGGTSQAYFDNLSITVPEPSSLLLLLVGLAGFGAVALVVRSTPRTPLGKGAA